MTSLFFEKIVSLLKETIGEENAYEIVEKHCKQMGVTPEELQADYGCLLVMRLRSDFSKTLPQKEWINLDERFKEFLVSTMVHRGKVKGIILAGVQTYISLKRGSIGLSQLKRTIDIPSHLRGESWYPIPILNDLLINANDMINQNERTRSRAIGRYVISSRTLNDTQYWFGKKQPSTYDAFKNIREILNLENFSLKKEDDQLILSFKDTVSKQSQDFLLGICDGIFKMRNIFPIEMELMNSQNSPHTISIILRYDEKEGHYDV